MTLMELLQKSVQIIEEQAAAKHLTGAKRFDILLIVGALDNDESGTLMASSNLAPEQAKAVAQYFVNTCHTAAQEYDYSPTKKH